MIRRPPRSTLSSSSAASDVYKRQIITRFYAKIIRQLFVYSNFSRLNVYRIISLKNKKVTGNSKNMSIENYFLRIQLLAETIDFKNSGTNYMSTISHPA